MDGADQIPTFDMEALPGGIRFFKSEPLEKKVRKKFNTYNLHIWCLFAIFCYSYSCTYMPIFAVILFCMSQCIILTNIKLNSLYYLVSDFNFANILSEI